MTASRTDGLTAVIYDIQRLSLNDGPGIRTTVFLKGCPLRCAWCHNPESWEREPRLAYTESLCRMCGECVRVCPTGAHALAPSPDAGGDGLHRIDRDKCDACGKCVRACPHDALSLCGREYTVPELYEALKPDLPYFGIGEGGGVTFSGGEPMARVEFLLEFLRRKGSLHVCLETSGQAPAEDFRRISPMVDLFLFDYKATGAERHRALCGEGNELILANLRLLCRSGARVLLRLPLVPGLNDQEEHLRAVAALLDELPDLEGAQILPYHALGAGKEARFGLEGRTLRLPSASAEQGEAWLKALESYGARKVFL